MSPCEPRGEDRVFVVFWVLVFRRLWLPSLPSSRNCRCGIPLDLRGHHRASCAQVGVLGRRGFALESVAARVCREGGAKVSTNVMLRGLDLLPQDRPDKTFGGCRWWSAAAPWSQLAIDTTMVSPLRRDGVPRPRSMSGRGFFGHSQETEGETLPRAFGSQLQLFGDQPTLKILLVSGDVFPKSLAFCRSFQNNFGSIFGTLIFSIILMEFWCFT